MIFARFLFQVVGVVVDSLVNHILESTLKYAENIFLCQQLAHILLYLMHMFQSGTFRAVTTSAMAIIKEENNEKFTLHYSINELGKLFLKLAPSYPTLVIQWCNILTLLNYDNQMFWTQIMQPYRESQVVDPSPISMQTSQSKYIFLPCNIEMVRRGGVILLCDYVCDNPTDVVQMTWLVVHHINDIIDLSFETTVQDFINGIHRNPAASGLLLQALINAQHRDLAKPSFVKRALQCLENIHISQSGKLIRLLVDNFLNSHHLLVANVCETLACKRLEMLLSDLNNNQLSVKDVDQILDGLHSSQGIQRHKTFISLCEKLKYLLSNEVSPTSTHPLIQASLHVPDIELNKEWFLKYVKEKCCDPLSPAKECAHLLSQLKYEESLTLMNFKDFKLSILEHCLSLGANMLMSSEKYVSSRSDDPFLGLTESLGSTLYRSAQSTLLQHLAVLHSSCPKTSKSTSCIAQLFIEDSFWDNIFILTPATTCYLKTLEFLPGRDIPVDLIKDVAHLSFLCSEAIIWAIDSGKNVSLEMLKITLHLLDSTLKNMALLTYISSDLDISWICSAVSAIHQLVKYLLQEQPMPSFVFPFNINDNSLPLEQIQAWKTCIKIVELIGLLEKPSILNSSFPGCLFSLLNNIIRGLARLPLVNSLARTPPVLWQLGWNPEFSGKYKTIVPPPPGEYLQDRDVLKQYIYRINLLGWISRQQFEETWMALLGVLSTTPVDDVDSKEEDQEHIRTSCLAVKCITSLLLQTLLLPQPGNPAKSFLLNQPRDKPLAFQHTKCGKKLMSVRSPIHIALQKMLNFSRIEEQILNVNAERVSASYSYSLSQVSLEYLNAAAGLAEENEELDGSNSSNSSPISTNIAGIASFQQREQSLANAGLDIHSCLHFLLDLYSQWLSPQACSFTPLTLLTEVAKSVVSLSDIFMEKAQFEWMLDTLLEVQRIHPAEDEIITQYLIFGICKAAAVLGIDQDILERLRKLVELSLKSTYLPTRISTLHGLLYLLEQGSGDESLQFLPTAIEYISKYLATPNILKPSTSNEDHILILWALAFYILENYQDVISDEEFSQKVYQLSLSICANSDEVASNSLYLTVLHGLERLLVAEILAGKEANQLLKLTVDRIRFGTPVSSLAALGLFLSCMYIGKSTNLWSNELVADSAKGSDKIRSSMRQIDSEFLLVAMERVTTLFDRIKKGYPFEAEIICEILPAFLMEFFPVQEILNKIITEFLSNQQPHPHLMAKVIFEVFQYLHKQSQEEIIHEWMMLSLSNFTQISPLSLAIWSLSCFFISASTNCWFQALFPFVQNRMGKMEEQDQIIFCIAGVNFKNQLHDEEQKRAFFSTIQNVAHPQTPYADLLQFL